jgi:hypothetical protein
MDTSIMDADTSAIFARLADEDSPAAFIPTRTPALNAFFKEYKTMPGYQRDAVRALIPIGYSKESLYVLFLKTGLRADAAAKCAAATAKDFWRFFEALEELVCFHAAMLAITHD